MQNNFVIAHDELGGLYMLFYSSTILFYSAVMSIVFYHLPVRFNLVAYSKLGQKKVDFEKLRATKSMKNIEDGLDEMIAVDEEAKMFDQ